MADTTILSWISAEVDQALERVRSQIATYTAPNAIRQTVMQHDLRLTQPTQRPKQAAWIDGPASADPTAE